MKAKRILSILLTGSMLLSLLPVSALAAAPVFDAPAQTTAKKAAPLVQEADASRSTEEEAATRSSRDLDAENGTADSITIQLKADGTPAGSGVDGNWYYDPSSGGRLYLYNGGFTLKPSSESGAESALQGVELIINKDADFADGTVGCWTNNAGIISDGTFQGNVNNNKTISDGTFKGEVFNYGTISDGTFKGEVYNHDTISDGTFQGSVYNSKDISGGTFQKPVNNYGGTISGGTFEEVVEMNESPDGVTIEGGTFKKGIKLNANAYRPTITDGLFDGEVFIERCRSPLFITGGLFTKAVNASSIDDPTNLQITGGYFVSKPTVPEGSVSFTSVSDQNGGNFQVPVNDGFSESYTSLYVPSGSSEQPNTITVKTDTALLDCRAADADADVSIMSSVVSKGGNTYEIPVQNYEKIVLVTEEPSTPPPHDPGGDLDPDFSSGASALGVVLATAGLGYATYVCGSSLYLYYVLPGGFIPSTRQELATVLWTTAGKPDPVSTALYTDIPADAIEQQKAARWCAEQGLLSDHGETFGPDTKVTNARIIRAWNSLKKVPVPIK